jgi:hypothetical protein
MARRCRLRCTQLVRRPLKYYADEDARRDWLKDFPDYDMPVHENPPYDRDRDLPQAEWR